MKQPDACVVRITDAQGKTQGTGFLVSTDGLIVTCAHVVEGTEPCVAFPSGEPQPAQLVATDEAHDVAILRVEGELSDNVEPARLGRSTGAYHRDFWSQGYRPLGGMEGIPAEGRVLHAVSECPGVEHMPLILKSQDIRKGMSGAPVYIPDWDLVVGMITGYWDSLEADTGFRDAVTSFAVPAEAIAALCPDVRLWDPPPEFSRPPPGVPFQAPAVPRYFVPRPEVSNDLKAHLLADEATAPGALMVSAVHGLGGIGKTTLVAALAHDPAVQARFPDGVLWATLGQQPEILSRLHEWIQSLGDYNFQPLTVDGATAHLRTLLHGKACLLVVDDAWQVDHLRPFLVGGEHCLVLVTTRNVSLARKVDARLYDLDVMTEAQALALFHARLGPLNGDREQAAALARELGYLPLALELAAAQMEAGLSWAELLDIFRQALANLAALDLDEATCRNESLRLSFRLSLEQLSSDDQDAFVWLGVLPEDVRLNPAMAATLWDQPKADARRRLRRLRDKALLKSVGDDCYTLHDLLHDEAKLRLAERMPLPKAHAALLARYRQKVPDEQWHRLPDDGYIHEHLTWHMEQAGQGEAIHALLREETPEGQNGWYEARERLGQTAGFLEDVHRAWQFADAESDIALQHRYALITTSLNSLAGKIPLAFLTAAVESDIWTLPQALAYARQVSDPYLRAGALYKLTPRLSELERRQVFTETVAAVREIEADATRAQALVALAPSLKSSSDIQLLEEALAAAMEIGSDMSRAEALMGLAPFLSEQLLEKALTAARGLRHEESRVEALAALVPLLPENERVKVLEEALATARGIRYEKHRAQALTVLAPHLPEAQRLQVVEQALATARGIRDDSDRAQALTVLAPHLPEAQRAQVLDEALAAAQKTKDAWSRSRALIALYPHQPKAQRSHVLLKTLEAVREIEDLGERSKTLAALAPHLGTSPEVGLMAEALAVAKGIWREWARVDALAALAPHLATLSETPLVAEVLAEAREIRDRLSRVRALASLAPHLPQTQQALVLSEALATAREIEYGGGRVQALMRLVPHLPTSRRGEVLLEVKAAVRRIEDGWIRAEALVALALHLEASSDAALMAEALKAARGIGNEWRRAEGLARLALHQSDAQRIQILKELLSMVGMLDTEWVRVGILESLAPHLAAMLGSLPTQTQSPSERVLIPEALSAVRELGDIRDRARVLAVFAPYVPQARWEQMAIEVQDAARGIENEWDRAQALTQLAPHLPKAKRAQVSEEALNAARVIEPEWRRAGALAQLVPHLAEVRQAQVAAEALAAARESKSEEHRVRVLAALAPHLREMQREKVLAEALGIARKIGNEKLRAGVLADLAPNLQALPDTTLMTEALMSACEIWDDGARAEALVGLAPYLSEHLLLKAQEAAQRIRTSGFRAEALAQLVPHFPEVRRSQIVVEALAAARGSEAKGPRVRVLAALAPHLPEMQREKVLAEALAAASSITHEETRAQALVHLAPHLAGLSVDLLYTIWQENLHVVAANNRRVLLSDIQALSPMILAIGGPKTVAETFYAIQDVGRWWP